MASDDPEVKRLSAELEAALVRELLSEWAHFNATFFHRAMRAPTIELSDTAARLGRWILDLRAIEISRALVLERPWGEVVEVMKHEMAHQYVHEVLRLTSETSHGPAFREVCQRLGIDARASGAPRAAGDEPAEGDRRVLERIARLLALAESANVHEAQAAMAAAQRLMLKHNLDVAATRAPRGYGFRHLGKPTGRVSEAERLLAVILGDHFFVEVIWVPVYRPLEGSTGRVLEACGTPANLEMAEYVHSFLTHAGESLWREHKRAHGLRSNRDRRTYIAGVMTGFLDKLAADRKTHASEGLVWAGDADLHRYYETRHPRVHTMRYTGNAWNEARAHGHEAGRKLVIHRPVQSGPSGGERLLTR